MYLTRALHRSVQLTPQATASVFQGRRRSFGELGSRVARLAGALRGLGLAAGDRVGMLALNSDWYLEYYLGVYWAGGVVNPVNTRWSAAEIGFSLNDCQTRVLIVDDNFLPMLDEVRRLSPGLQTLIHVGDGAAPAGLHSYEALLAGSQPVADAYRGGEELAGVFYTGGTTGFPKGVMLSHRGLYVNGMTLAAEGLLQPGCFGSGAAVVHQH